MSKDSNVMFKCQKIQTLRLRQTDFYGSFLTIINI